MQYKLKKQPELIYWSETRSIIVTDEQDKEIEIRAIETPEGVKYWKQAEEDQWIELEDVQVIEWLNGEMIDQELIMIQQELDKLREIQDEVDDIEKDASDLP